MAKRATPPHSQTCPTEIEAITGSSLWQAASVHMELPANRVVYQLITALTARPPA